MDLSGGGGGPDLHFWSRNRTGGPGVSEDFVSRSPGVTTDLTMGSFSLSPIDFEPLTNLFGFAPSAYKDLSSVYKEKNPHDMADVLLSLKHAVIHPGQVSVPSPVGNFGGYGAAQQATQMSPTSVSFSVHPQTQVMSPPHAYATAVPSHHHHHHGYTAADPMLTSSSSSPGHHHLHHHHHHHPGTTTSSHLFPSMSVNVSMNMTMGMPGMHGPYNVMEQMGSPHHHHLHHQQWGVPSPVPQNPVAAAGQTPSSYSFTAEFRPSSSALCGAAGGGDPAATTVAFDKDFGLKNISMNVTTPFKTLKSCAYGFSPTMKKSPVGRSNSGGLALSPFLNGPSSDGQQSDAGKTNLCRICGKTYARPSTLKTHMRTHSGEKPYRCATCHKSFSQAANLTAHIRTHSGEKPFRCPICDRRFSQSSSVTTHMRTHSGERPYRCRLCKKAFSDSSTLTKHLRIHSGEKPYQCKLCLLRFSQSGNLNRHMRVHSAPV